MLLGHLCIYLGLLNNGNISDSCFTSLSLTFFFVVVFFVFFLPFSRAAPTAYGGSQASGPIGAAAAGLRQSHSDVGSQPRLQSTLQLTATPDP